MKKILILSTILMLTMTSLVLASTCFQESPTFKDQTGQDGNCGLSYNGKYQSYGFNRPDLMFDGDYNSYGNWMGMPATLYINYSKPVNTTNAIWKLKTGNSIGIYDTTFNLSRCINNSIMSLKIYHDNRMVHYYCFNTDWIVLGDYYAYNLLFEESINWEIGVSNDIQVPQNNTNNQTCTNQTIIQTVNVESIFKPSTISFNFTMNKIGTYVCNCVIV
jgi:hypothetical protein